MQDFKKLGRNFNALVIVPIEKIDHQIFKVIKQFPKIPCIYISLGHRWTSFQRKLKKEGIGEERFYFIDCVSPKTTHFWEHQDIAGMGEKKAKVTFTGTPSDLGSIYKKIKKFKTQIKGKHILIVDNVANFIVYNNYHSITEFLINLVDHNDHKVIVFNPIEEDKKFVEEIESLFQHVIFDNAFDLW